MTKRTPIAFCIRDWCIELRGFNFGKVDAINVVADLIVATTVPMGTYRIAKRWLVWVHHTGG
ncbi:hypothetical protein Pmar_PMAR023924 [Perkinsus marinus ATCC 50983]|uniref:Uncharacterized protein n=1 Tax=Perkinsus marinus (strain ATCC 50983 / TXsc) TaxID=423536 RepID=C5KR18_PERM5|nr:hypothetical protein Pmar_PMAR023924 [Perkinsus marinus ATCC 50983]EER13074.1 hypothetical protein Pmar_PMAR023924 [Perkinsus marinus ATCC 50983]|eukprot:XP_002781279.1 hypothetical protein Pmar_PMAR023924 [Perkinsus marinus ATCC 50983]